MVVEVVATATGAQRYRRAVRRLGVVATVLTFGRLFVWDNHDAHRSMFSLVMLMIWMCTTLLLAGLTIAGPDEEDDDMDDRERRP